MLSRVLYIYIFFCCADSVWHASVMDADDNPIQTFISVTGASTEVASQYVNRAHGNVDEAVTQFFQDLDSGVSPASSPESSIADGVADAGRGLATVDAIVGGVKDQQNAAPNATPQAEEAPSGPPPCFDCQGTGNIPGMMWGNSSCKTCKGSGKGAVKGGGKGSGKGERKTQTVAIAFFADGFMVDDDYQPEPDTPDPSPSDAPAAAPRRTGMMGLSDLKKDSKRSRGPMPKLPKLKPLRPYDTPENKAFLDDVNASKLPKELQKRDEAGRPIAVSIAIEDVRPKTYKELSDTIEKMEQMEKDEAAEEAASNPTAKPSVALFTGAGNSLSSSSGPSGGVASGAWGPSGGSGVGADPLLLKLVSGAMPVVDDSKPATTIQIRLATGSRLKSRLNMDHTVGDIWRLIAAEIGIESFRAAAGHEISAGFPPKTLLDSSLSLATADLANAAITHRCQK